MKGKLKVLTLGLVAAFAMSAFGAASASAETDLTYHVAEAPASILGTGANNVFETNAGVVECEVSEFTGEQSETTAHILTLNANYENCTAFGFSASVNMNECHYEFTTPTTTTEPHQITIPVHVRCEGSSKIEIIAAGGLCKVTVGEQSPEGGLEAENSESGGVKDVDTTINVSGISYTGSGFCGSGTNGTYEGTATVQAFNEGEEAIDAWIE